MIIKSKRIRARGQALKRALLHISEGEENDAIELISGNVADLEDARSDALRFGREYAVRHWILSPSQEISTEQLLYLVALLAAEFGFDLDRAVIWRHTKSRAVDSCNQHYHLCAPEVVDAVTGRMMSSSHDWRKHEKIARTVEVLWGHAIVPGRHTAAVVAALERKYGADADVVTALREVVPIDHPQSFDETSHQRLKRDGLDLPRLRERIADALSSSSSRVEFDAKLVALGLRLRAGDKQSTQVIETADGNTLVGSLARLTRLREAALQERLRFNAECSSKSQTYHSPSDVPFGAATRGPDGAAIEARGQRRRRRRGPAGPNGHDGELVAADSWRDRSGSRQVGEPGSASGRPTGGQSDKIGYARLKFALGCLSHQNRLLDSLGEARRSALPPLERAEFDLDGLIERETRIGYTAAPPEPTSLHIARRNAVEAKEQLRALEKRASGIEQQLAARQPASIWRRFWQPAGDPSGTATLETRLDSLQRKILVARGNYTSATQALKTEENKFQIACTQHESAMSARRTQAGANAAAAQAARKFLEKNPRAAFWGAPCLMRVATDIQKARGQWREAPDSNVQDNWSLIPILDLWGKPYLPPPR
jgi:hypothetical protein